MAASNLNLGKASGGVLNVQPADGVTNTSLVLPAINGTVVVADSNGNVAVGLNTPKARLDVYTLGITGGLPATTGSSQDPNVMARISGNSACMDFGAEPNGHQWIQCRNLTDYSVKYDLHLQPNGGNVLVTGTGGLGYGTGSGGIVTQLTSKSTAVTLNKPTGIIIMNNAALAAGATVGFTLHNNIITSSDVVVISLGGTGSYSSYYIRSLYGQDGNTTIYVTNQSGVTLSEAIGIKFSVIKGANS